MRIDDTKLPKYVSDVAKMITSGESGVQKQGIQEIKDFEGNIPEFTRLFTVLCPRPSQAVEEALNGLAGRVQGQGPGGGAGVVAEEVLGTGGRVLGISEKQVQWEVGNGVYDFANINEANKNLLDRCPKRTEKAMVIKIDGELKIVVCNRDAVTPRYEIFEINFAKGRMKYPPHYGTGYGTDDYTVENNWFREAVANAIDEEGLVYIFPNGEVLIGDE